jgi:hypothetical protein
MINEFKVYTNIKYIVIIGLIMFSITSFIGTTMIFFNNESTIHLFTGIINIIFSLFIAYITFQKINNRKPEIVLNELGIWLKGMEKLYPWALIEKIELRQFNNDNEILYKNFLCITLNNEDTTLTIPFDEFDSSYEDIKEVLKHFKRDNLIS